MTRVFRCDKIPFLFWIATILCWPGVVLAQALQIMPVTLALPSGQLTATVLWSTAARSRRPCRRGLSCGANRMEPTR